MAQAPALPHGFELPLEPRLPRIGSVDQVAVEERAASLSRRSIKRESKLFALDLAIRMMDLTTLEGADTPGKVAALASKAMRPDPSDLTIPPVAAVCIYPNLIEVARERLGDSGVKVASVATAFPSGQTPTDIKIAEAARAAELGADEIDMVIDRGAFLSGNYARVYEEVRRVKDAVGEAHLKVILETGELGTYDNVRRASLLAVAGGRLHQDLDREDPAGGDATGHARHARGHPRRLRGDGTADRNEARRGHPPRQTGGAVPRPPARDARARMADARPVPLRRELPPQRRSPPDSQGEDGPLPKPGLLHP
jgi:deoxyribose-phosphate aldolase